MYRDEIETVELEEGEGPCWLVVLIVRRVVLLTSRKRWLTAHCPYSTCGAEHLCSTVAGIGTISPSWLCLNGIMLDSTVKARLLRTG